MTERPDDPNVEETAPDAAEATTPDVQEPAAASGTESAASAGEASGNEPSEAPATDEPPAPEAPAPEESPATAPTESATPDPAPAQAASSATAPATASRPRGSRGAQPEEAPAVRATARYVRTSARKARLVSDTIRGKSVTEARAILAFTPRAAAKPWSKLLESAVANAEHNHELVGEDLRIAAIHADEGPTLKRFQPRAMGRATRIRKRTSHLTIILSPRDVPAGTRRGARRKGGR